MKNNQKLKCYKDFRGLDLASDPVLIDPHRAPYMINMYKDYSSQGGKALETIVGFRNRMNFDLFFENEISIIDFYFFTKNDGENEVVYPIIHYGNKLILWDNFPLDKNKEEFLEKTVLAGEIDIEKVDLVKEITILGESIPFSTNIDNTKIYIDSDIDNVLAKIKVVKNTIKEEDTLYEGVSQNKLNYFTYGERLYIIDGNKYLSYDGEVLSEVVPYIPTTRIGITANSIGEELDFRNMISSYFYNTITADGESTTFYLSEKELEEVAEVSVYGNVVSNYSCNLINGSITFSEPPQNPIVAGYNEGYSGIKVLCKKDLEESGKVLKMRDSEIYDGRVFLTDNQENGTLIVYSALDNMSYFPIVNYIHIENVQLKSILAISKDLFVLAKDGGKTGIYLLTEQSTGILLNPSIYTVKGISSTKGCITNAVNFCDCPTFLGKRELNVVTSQNLKMERNIEKRSTLIAPALNKIEEREPILFTFDGYIAIYFDGDLFLGDSRQNYINEQGEREFEWYKIGKVGRYKNQYKRYTYDNTIYDFLENYLPKKEIVGKTANEPTELGISQNEIIEREIIANGKIYKYKVAVVKIMVAEDFINGEIVYSEKIDEYLVKEEEDYIGGTFEKASYITSFDGNIYFCNKGGVYSFNFDKKGLGFMKENYSFDNRTIVSGVATAMDNLNYPDLKKRTIPKSLVIKCKTMPNSTIKVLVRTNKTSFTEYGSFLSGYFDFNKINFNNLTFNTSDQQVFVVDEREKGWLEKQLYLTSDRYQSPFSVYYVTYRYEILGKVK